MTATLSYPRAFTVDSRDLIRWDIKTAKVIRYKLENPTFRPLSDFAEEATEIVRPTEKPEAEWPVYGVSNEIGVFLSHRQKGSTFNSPYKRVRKDWFFHNPTRANVGSLGRVPEVPSDAITSPEYQVWRIRSGLTPDFMELLLRMPFFMEQVESHRVGAVKERLFVQNLLKILIPPLSAAQQNKIVAIWQKAQDTAAKSREMVAAMEKEIQVAIFKTLGMKPPRYDQPLPKVFTLLWKEVERWGVGFNRLPYSNTTLLAKSSYPAMPLASVAWINPLTNFDGLSSESLVSFVPMEAVSDTLGNIISPYERKLGQVRAGFTRFQEKDVIWAKITPCMQNGKSVVAKGLKNGFGCGSTEFHVVRPKCGDELLPEYIWALLRLHEVRLVAKKYFVGSAGQQRVPPSFLENLTIPVPPKDIQQRVVDVLIDQRQRIADEKISAEKGLSRTTREIEEMILRARPAGALTT